MEKTKINRFIQKYNLSGNVDSVKWKTGDSKLSTSFVTPDKSLLGSVEVDNVKFEDSELGIYTTSQLQKMLGVLGDTINVSTKKIGTKVISLTMKNGGTSVDYVLSDLSVIPEPPKLKKLPKFETKIKIDTQFIDTFVKGKAALSEVDNFTILSEGGEVMVVIGYSSTNTNRVNIPVETTENGMTKPISFNANLFKEVLVANKDCTSAVLEVSNEGLARVNFKVDDFNSTYFVVAMSEV